MNTAEYAVYVAESLQTPVIVLSDQALGQAHDRHRSGRQAAEAAQAPHQWRAARHARSSAMRSTADPVTPMPLPGTPGYQWVAEGLTHNEVGLPASGAGAHVAQINKRARKLQRFDPGDFWGESWGDGDTAIAGFRLERRRRRGRRRARLAAAGHPIRVVALRVLVAAADASDRRARSTARAASSCIEQNHSAQLYRHLIGHKAIPPSAESVARPGPLPFRPSEIASYVM